MDFENEGDNEERLLQDSKMPDFFNMADNCQNNYWHISILAHGR